MNDQLKAKLMEDGRNQFDRLQANCSQTVQMTDAELADRGYRRPKMTTSPTTANGYRRSLDRIDLRASDARQRGNPRTIAGIGLRASRALPVATQPNGANATLRSPQIAAGERQPPAHNQQG